MTYPASPSASPQLRPAPALIGPRRPLSPEEAEAALVAKRGLGSVAPSIKNLRARHHEMAQMFARGMAPGDVGAAFGLSPSRISIMQADPTFRELVSGYAAGRVAAYGDLTKRLVALGTTAADELLDRLEEAPETFSNSDLIATLKTSADRSGFGPTSTVQIARPLAADALRALKERVREVQGVSVETTGPDRGAVLVGDEAEAAGDA